MPPPVVTKSADNFSFEIYTLTNVVLQKTIAIKNKIEGLLSHIAQLDAVFSTPPLGDVPERRRRDELKEYCTTPLHAHC